MTRAEELKVGRGDRVRYRGFDMVVESVATRLQRGLPRVLDLAWPEQPDKPVYRSIMARMVTLAPSSTPSVPTEER